MSKQQIILNCYSDLCRAATAFYLNPSGKTHLLFLKHALSLLQRNNLSGMKEYTNKLNHLMNQTNWSNEMNRTNPIYLADKIFTLGVLLKTNLSN